MEETLPPGMFKRGGVYYVRKMIRGVLERKSTGKRDFKSALRRYHEIMQAWNDGASGWDQLAPTFRDYWETHYRPAYTLRKTPTPNGSYRDDQLVQFALSCFGRMRLDQITHSMCQRMALRRRGMTYERRTKEGQVTLSRPYAEGTVTRELSLVQAIFEAAVRDGYIDRNPLRGVDRASRLVRERVLTHEEQGPLLAQLTPRYRRWVLFMLGTGLRLEEARNIRPERDLDLDGRAVRVTRKTKGLKKKVQWVPLFDDDVLAIVREQLSEEKQLWPQDSSTVQEVLKKAAVRAGIPHLSPHTLRHTFATRYLAAGGNIYTLSQILGHSSVQITEKVYAHLQKADLLKMSTGLKLGLLEHAPATVLPFKVG